MDRPLTTREALLHLIDQYREYRAAVEALPEAVAESPSEGRNAELRIRAAEREIDEATGVLAELTDGGVLHRFPGQIREVAERALRPERAGLEVRKFTDVTIRIPGSPTLTWTECVEHVLEVVQPKARPA